LFVNGIKLERDILICERKKGIEHSDFSAAVFSKGTVSGAAARKQSATHNRKLDVYLYTYNVTSLL
jgi:hypothetical protein